MNCRHYSIRANTAPGINPPPVADISGAITCGPFTAARRYAAEYLPGYDVIPGGRDMGPGLRAFDAIDYPGHRGAVLWVRELNGGTV